MNLICCKRLLLVTLTGAVILFAGMAQAQTSTPVDPPLPTPFPTNEFGPTPVLPTVPPANLEPTATPTSAPDMLMLPSEGAVQIGEPFAARLEANTGIGDFTLSAAEMDIVAVRITWEQPETYIRVQLVGPEGQLVTQANSGPRSLISFFWIMPTSGEYTVKIINQSVNDTIISLLVTLPTITEVEANTSIEGTLTAQQDTQIYAFEGNANDLLYVQAQGEAFVPFISLMRATATERTRLITSQQGVSDSIVAGEHPSQIGPMLLTETSRYLVVVSSLTGQLGDFSLSIEQPQAQHIIYGDTIEVEITETQPQAYLLFEAAYGDIIDILVEAQDDLDTHLELGTTDGFVLFQDDDSGAGANPEILRTLLTLDTTYLIEVTPLLSSATGTVTVTLRLNPEASLDNGPQIAVMKKSNQMRFSFNAVAGEVVQLNLTLLEGVNMPGVQVQQPTMTFVNVPVNSLNSLELGFTVPNSGPSILLLFTNGSESEALVEVGLTRVSDDK